MKLFVLSRSLTKLLEGIKASNSNYDPHDNSTLELDFFNLSPISKSKDNMIEQ